MMAIWTAVTLTASLGGCAHPVYSVAQLPAEYSPPRVCDYSTVDLTAVTRQLTDAQRIAPNDRLRVQLHTGAWEHESQRSWTVGVDERGRVDLPTLGRVELEGLTPAEAEDVIAECSRQRDIYRTPVVGVEILDRASRPILVEGAVARPGALSARESHISLADVIARSGGLTPHASGRIHLSQRVCTSGIMQAGHSIPKVRTIDLRHISPHELAAMDIPHGAIVKIEPIPPRRIQIMGVIANRTVEIPPGRNLRMLEALAMAGGPTYSTWISDRVLIIRQIPGKDDTIRIRGSIRAARRDASQNLLLAAEDIVSVEENVITFSLSTLQSLFAVGTSGTRMMAL